MAERGDIKVFYCPDCEEQRAHVYTADEQSRTSLKDQKCQLFIVESFGGYYYALVWKCTTCNRKIAV